ncbi:MULTISPECIES: chromate transporter [Bradyrhizobium]|uniref:chromate transporter n=1 Tax=Bradyrhizobium TaxID=374 RepID=UPI000463F2F2|nr:MULTISPECIES: chromate transporter [Bradyrhizobium]
MDTTDRKESKEEIGSRAVSKRELFLGFLKIGLLGFGGIAPWARHIIVEERQWVTDKEFAAILGVGQILPGPNTMNAAVMLGDRFQGVIGVLLCLLGQMIMPLVIVTSLAMVYERFASVPEVRGALIGAAAGAAGLVMGTALKMTQKIRPSPIALLIAVIAFILIGLLGWPLVPVVLVVMPLSIAAAVLDQRP